MQTLILGFKYFFIDLVGGVIRWPFWWYTNGLLLVGTWGWQTITGYAKMLAVGVWIKNVFVPMFGFYDWQSRLISIFMRLANIIGRSIAVFLLALLVLVCVVAYVLILPFSIIVLFYQIGIVL